MGQSPTDVDVVSRSSVRHVMRKYREHSVPAKRKTADFVFTARVWRRGNAGQVGGPVLGAAYRVSVRRAAGSERGSDPFWRVWVGVERDED